jgi:hypothetical protein
MMAEDKGMWNKTGDRPATVLVSLSSVRGDAAGQLQQRPGPRLEPQQRPKTISQANSQPARIRPIIIGRLLAVPLSLGPLGPPDHTSVISGP